MHIKSIEAAARHRNGCTGVLFDDPNACAVFDHARLAAGDVAFASNSWRGDLYSKPLRHRLAHREVDPADEIDAPVEADRRVAVFWHVDDVLGVRPDLSEDQARSVLDRACRDHDPRVGINLDVLVAVADRLVPR